jgi:hypothetical protein
VNSSWQNKLLHIAIIIVFIGSRFVFVEPGPHHAHNPQLTVCQEVFRYTLLACFFYFHQLYLIPNYYFTKRHSNHLGWIFVCYCIIAYLPNLLFFPYQHKDVFSEMNIRFDNKLEQLLYFLKLYVFKLHTSYYIFFSLFFLSLVLAVSNRLRVIATEKTESELKFLKAQINPHFLFNSLNSIYGLALTKNEKAPSAVLKLSDMMRYVTDESKNEFVPLKKEMNYLNNYIDLQQMRMPTNTKLEYNLSVSNESKQIAPLILIHFVENAFKHGLSIESPSTIQIDIITTDDELSLYTANRKLNNPKYNQDADSIGLQNTVNRLKMLYPGAHKLTIDDTPSHYYVTLKMNLI